MSAAVKRTADQTHHVEASADPPPWRNGHDAHGAPKKIYYDYDYPETRHMFALEHWHPLPNYIRWSTTALSLGAILSYLIIFPEFYHTESNWLAKARKTLADRRAKSASEREAAQAELLALVNSKPNQPSTPAPSAAHS